MQMRREEYHVFKAMLVDVSVDGEGNLVLFLSRRSRDADKLARILKRCIGTKFTVTLRGWREEGTQGKREGERQCP